MACFWDALKNAVQICPASTDYSKVISELDSIALSSLITSAEAMAISGNNLFIAGQSAASPFTEGYICAFDISDPQNLVAKDVQLSSNLAWPTDIKIVGDYAYVVAAVSKKLVIFDISDTSNIIEKDNHSSANIDSASAVDVIANKAYVLSWGAGDSNLTVCDVSNPAAITELGNYTSTGLGQAFGLDVEGSFAYIASYNNDKVSILDVSNPASITARGTFSNANTSEARKIIKSGIYAYIVTYSTNKFTVLNVSNVDAITEVDSFSDAAIWGNCYFDTQLNYAYVGSAITTLDISNPAAVSKTDLFNIPESGDLNAIVVQNQFLFGLDHTNNKLRSFLLGSA